MLLKDLVSLIEDALDLEEKRLLIEEEFSDIADLRVAVSTNLCHVTDIQVSNISIIYVYLDISSIGLRLDEGLSMIDKIKEILNLPPTLSIKGSKPAPVKLLQIKSLSAKALHPYQGHNII